MGTILFKVIAKQFNICFEELSYNFAGFRIMGCYPFQI